MSLSPTSLYWNQHIISAALFLQTPPDSSFGGGGGGAQRDLPQPGDDVRVGGVKGQAVHLHGQMGSFAASDPETHQRGEEGLLLVEDEEKTA